jgi:hypothetical protein
MSESVLVVDPNESPDEPEKLFVVKPHVEQAAVFDVKPVFISMGMPSSAFAPEVGGFLRPEDSPFTQPKGMFDAAVRGTGTFDDRIWLFRGDAYSRYDGRRSGRESVSDFLPIDPNWRGFPPAFRTGIDAGMVAISHGLEGQAWFFKGSNYLRYSLGADAVTNPSQSIAENWHGFAASFGHDLDATIHGVGDFVGMLWFFKGSEYLRYNLAVDMVDIGPVPIAERWNGWPQEFTSVDFAFYGAGAEAEHIYFFRGSQYVRYSLPEDRVVEGPAPVLKRFAAIERLLPVPQIFAVEHYALSRFHGQLGKGDFVGEPIRMVGGEKREFSVVTKKRVTTSTTETQNILETASDAAAEQFSDAVRKGQEKSGSTDSIQYGLDASFHGEARATSISGGEVDAQLKVRGQFDEVRTGFADEVDTQVSKEASQTHEAHREQVRQASAEEQVDEEVETRTLQVIDNSANPNPVVYVLFQLIQEHLVMLRLVDVQLAFHNGHSGQGLTVPLSRAAEVLDKCLLDPIDRDAVLQALLTTTTNVEDHRGTPRSLLVDGVSPELLRLDKSLTTRVEFDDDEGNVIRTVEADGLVVHTDRPRALTDQVALARLHGID